MTKLGNGTSQNKRYVGLREIDERDIPHFSRNLSYPEIARFLDFEYPYTEENAREFIEKDKFLRQLEHRVCYSFSIDLGNVPAGYIRLEGIAPKSKRAFLTYWLSGFFWGEGVMSEALDRVINYSFNSLELEELGASVVIDNVNSCNLLESRGFRVEDRWPRSFKSPVDGKFYDGCLYVLENKYMLN